MVHVPVYMVGQLAPAVALICTIVEDKAAQVAANKVGLYDIPLLNSLFQLG